MVKHETTRRQADSPSDSRPALRIPPLFFAGLAALWLVLVWFQIAKINGQYTATINEGFSSYQQATVAHGEKVYGSPPKFVYQNYPPFSFHLVGSIGQVIHDVNVAGRWISLIAYLAIGLFTGLIVYRFTRSRDLALLGTFCWLIWLAAFDPQRIGYNDPHMLGVALSLAGFYAFIREPGSARGLYVSAVIFSLSIFTKPTLIAFPAAVAIQLFFASRRRLMVWLGTCVGLCAVLLAITLAVDGPYFVQHQMMPRPYDPWGILESLNPYVHFFEVPLVAVILWLVLRRPELGEARIAVWNRPVPLYETRSLRSPELSLRTRIGEFLDSAGRSPTAGRSSYINFASPHPSRRCLRSHT